MSRHISHDAANWVRSNYKCEPSRLGEQVAHIVGIAGGGIYNAIASNARIDWTNERFIELTVHSYRLATFDFSELTYLVFLCHEARVRLEVSNGGPRRTKLVFHRRSHEGGMSKRHPSLDEAIAEFRRWLPPDHPLIYRPEQLPAEAAHA